MRPSNLGRGIKRWLNGQILAADPGQSRVSAAESWPLRQRFLLPFCYSLLAMLDLLESWGYSWTTPGLGFSLGFSF